MNKSRLEAFSDGVFAIIITIMVLELKVPEVSGPRELVRLLPMLGSYLLSFAYLGIYWGNHHHLLHSAKRVSSAIIWANMHLLFWLSLVPFSTAWMGRTHFERFTVAVYGGLLLVCGLAYTVLSKAIMRTHKEKTPLTDALAKGDIKGVISVVLYGSSIPIAIYVHPMISAALFVAVAIMWIIPSREIERALTDEHNHKGATGTHQ